jgi:hypothetical protein
VFTSCGITEATIGKGLKTLNRALFLYCGNLKNIVIPENITRIQYLALVGCGFTSLTIPDSVLTIDGYGIAECYGLKTLYFEGDAPMTEDNIFAYQDKSQMVIYYYAWRSGWTNPWYGVRTVALDQPIIITHPVSQSVLEGEKVVFTVDATGADGCQWYKDSIAIAGAMGTSYIIESVGEEDVGEYFVVLTNKYGSVTSDIAVLSYLTPPTITAPPVSLTVDAGTLVSFQVEALGADSYQWYRNDIPISGATGALYTIDSAKGIDVGTYKVIITNRAGIATSTATLALTQPYRATGTVQVVNGYVVGLTVTDGGWGYTREPKFRIKDETGSGASGHCVIENGVVTQIILDQPGSDYSGEATVLIGSPIGNSSLRIGVSEVEVEMSLVLGMEYQLWSSVDCINWEQVGEPFTAEEEEMTFFFKVADYGRFFKLQEI